jgi:predicted GIY-YIG superfamily endonuclease
MWEPLPAEQVTKEDHPWVVYYLFDEDEEPVYIGLTSGVNQRFHTHSYCGPFWSEVTAFSLEFHRTYAEVFNAERKAILDHCPRYNSQRFAPRDNPGYND